MADAGDGPVEVTILHDWCNLQSFRPVLQRVVPIYNARSENAQYSLLDKFSRTMTYEAEFNNHASKDDLALGGETARMSV